MKTDLWEGVDQAKASPPGGVALAFAVPVKTDDATTAARLRLLHQLARELGYVVRRVSPPLPTTGHPGIRRAVGFIAQHFTEPLTVGTVAKHVGLCPQQFRKRFKQSTGLTCRQYLTLCRIERAKELLLLPDCKVLSAGLDAGFRSTSVFYHHFRQHTGESPAAYRRKLVG